MVQKLCAAKNNIPPGLSIANLRYYLKDGNGRDLWVEQRSFNKKYSFKKNCSCFLNCLQLYHYFDNDFKKFHDAIYEIDTTNTLKIVSILIFE